MIKGDIVNAIFWFTVKCNEFRSDEMKIMFQFVIIEINIDYSWPIWRFNLINWNTQYTWKRHITVFIQYFMFYWRNNKEVELFRQFNSDIACVICSLNFRKKLVHTHHPLIHAFYLSPYKNLSWNCTARKFWLSFKMYTTFLSKICLSIGT